MSKAGLIHEHVPWLWLPPRTVQRRETWNVTGSYPPACRCGCHGHSPFSRTCTAVFQLFSVTMMIWCNEQTHAVTYCSRPVPTADKLRPRRYDRISSENRHFKGVGQFVPKFQVERERPPPTILHFAKLDAAAFHTVENVGRSFLSFCHNSRVWQIDGLLIARPRCSCNAVKKYPVEISGAVQHFGRTGTRSPVHP